MDRPLSEQHLRSQKRRKWIAPVAILIGLVVAIIIFRNQLEARVKSSEVVISTVEAGSIEATITATGTIVPEYEQALTVPEEARLEEVLIQAGTRVDSGQKILSLTSKKLENQLASRADELELSEATYEKTRLQWEKSIYDLESAISIKRLRIRGLEALVEDQKKLLKVGGGTAEEVEKAEMDLQIARIELRQMENEIANRRSQKIATLRELDLQVAMAERSYDEAKRRWEMAQVRPQRSGTVTFVHTDRGVTLRPGQEVARVADLSRFKVDARIADEYIDFLQPGQKAYVQVNRKPVEAIISSIEPTVQNGRVAFELRFEGNDFSGFRPNMTVEVYVVTNYSEETLIVRNGSAFSGSGQQEVFVMKDGQGKRQRVQVGLSNFEHVEILQGVKEGDQVVITQLPRLRHRQTFKMTGRE
ncbi:HlyD family efflux transporter periplasmic adaptor subunit [Cryomorphaceae bacterium]|nr:HlyD family efflux transporter periplasmic adaptor subunit [Cryomorphaceae bacterium]